MNKEELVSAVERELQSEIACDYDEVESRVCESDRFEGVSITVTGMSVPIRPILDAVEELEDWRIENIGMYSDADFVEEDGKREYQYGVIAFCPYVSDITESELFV